MLSKFQQLNIQEREHYGGLGVDGRRILEGTIENKRNWVELSPCGCGIEPPVSIRHGVSQ